MWHICFNCLHSCLEIFTWLSFTYRSVISSVSDIQQFRWNLPVHWNGRAGIVRNPEISSFKGSSFMWWSRLAFMFTKFPWICGKWYIRIRCHLNLHPPAQIEGSIILNIQLCNHYSVSPNFLGYVFPTCKIHLLPSLPFYLPFSLPLHSSNETAYQKDAGRHPITG